MRLESRTPGAATAVLRMQTAAEVRAYLTERLRKLCPQVANLDTT